MFQDIILPRHEGSIILPRIIISAVSGLRVITGYHPVSGVRRNNLTNDPVVPLARVLPVTPPVDNDDT